MKITSVPTSSSITNSQNNSYNTSFGFKIIKPKRMPLEMVDNLLEVKDVFDAYPDTTVRLVHTTIKKMSKGIHKTYIGRYPGIRAYWSARFIDTSLEFDLGKNFRGESQKFRINWYDKVWYKDEHKRKVRLKKLRDYLPCSDRVARVKRENIEHIMPQITRDNIQKRIKQMHENIENAYAKRQYRDSILSKAKECS